MKELILPHRGTVSRPHAALAVMLSVLALPLSAHADDVADLRRELEASRAAIERLEQRILDLESARTAPAAAAMAPAVATAPAVAPAAATQPSNCLLYTSDAADERSSVDLGGRRIIKKKKNR